MSFLNPLFLWVLPLTGLPILLHLLNKKPPQRVLFSHLKWLEEAHKTTMPKKKFQDILLLIFRTLMILFLILFFSRPVLHKGDLFAAGAQESAMVILIDQSASMGAVEAGRNALDIAKDEIQKLLGKIPTGTKVGLVAYSDRVEQELAPTSERSRVLAALESLKVKPRPTDVFPAIKLASEMLANQAKGKRSVLIVSDQASHGWQEALSAGGRWENYDPETAFTLWEVMGPKKDSGLIEAQLQLSEEGVLKGHFVALQQEAPSAVPAWTLTLNGRVVGSGALPVKKGRFDVPLQAQLPEGGFYSGQISLTPDSAVFNNSFYLAGRVPRGFRLLIVDGESGLAPTDSESYYLKSALESPRDPRLKSVRVVRPEVLPQEVFSDYDVIVLANTANVAGREADLTRWVETGGGLFLTAGAKWPKPPEAPLKIFRSRARKKGTVSVKPPVLDAPVIAGVSGAGGFQWDQVQVNEYVPLELDSSSTPLLTLSDGEPFLLRKQIGKGFVFCLTSSLDRSWTNFPAKPAFAPLMRELIASLADPFREQASLTGFVDRDIRINMGAEVSNVTVTAPDGNSGGGRVGKDGVLTWTAPLVEGLYGVRTDKRDNDFAFAINIRGLEKESDATRITEDELKTIFPRASVTFVSSGGRSGENVLAALEGRDVTLGLIIFLLLLFLAETYVAWPKRKVA